MEFRPLPYENPEPTGSQYAQLWANSINDIGDTFAQNKRLRMVQEEENRRAKQDEFARAIQMLQVRDQYGSVGARRILQPNAPPKPILGRTSMAPGASRGNPMPIRAQSEMPMESMDLERPDQFAQARELYGSQGVAPFLEARKFGQETEDRDLDRRVKEANIDQSNAAAEKSRREQSVDPRRETNIASFRGKIETSEPYKTWQTATAAEDFIRQATNNPSAFGDVGMVYGFIKLLDPTSVVREGEIKLLGVAASVKTRLESAVNKMARGETLTPEQRADLANWAGQKKSMAANLLRSHAEPTITQSNRLGYPVREIAPWFEQMGSGGRMSKQQRNKATGETITVYSDDGGQTWHP